MSREGDLLRKEALEASEIAWWSYNRDSGETFFSDRYFTMLGYLPGAFPSTFQAWVNLMHPEEADAVVESFKTFIQTSKAGFQFEHRLRTASGGWRWILVRARVVGWGPEGRPQRVAGIHLDITQRKLMEKALVESEARWTGLVNEAPTGISLVGPGGVLLFVNRNHTGFPDASSLGRNWKDFLPPEVHPAVDQALDQAIRREQTATFWTWMPGEDGRRIHIENRASPVRENGAVAAALVISRDVSAQVQADQRRAQSHRRMELLLEVHSHLRSGIRILVDSALAACLELTGSRVGAILIPSAGEARLMPLPWLPPGTPVPGPAPIWAEALEKRVPAVSDGPPWFLAVPMMEDGTVIAVVGVGEKAQPYEENDIEELTLLTDALAQLQKRQQAEEALELLRQAVEHSPAGIIITDARAAIEYANPRFLTMTGYEASEVLGASPRMLKSELVAREVYEDLWRTIQGGRRWQGELINKKKNGELFHVLVSISPVVDSRGEIVHCISVNEDITERKRAQELLAQAQKMETVGQLAAGVAHDFNNLLTSVLGFNQMLLRKLEEGHPLRKYAEKIEASGRRAADLVAGLLAVGRQQRLTKSRIDLVRLLRDDEPLLASLVKEGIVLETKLKSDPLEVEVDPGQISQVVVNLVSNARDALEGRGRITVSTGKSPDGGWAWFRVEDDGPGIPPSLREKIFEPFFTTKAIGQGTGMGLSIVQGIVQQHQGAIELETEPGAGARFTVRLPLAGAVPV